VNIEITLVTSIPAKNIVFPYSGHDFVEILATKLLENDKFLTYLKTNKKYFVNGKILNLKYALKLR
jgi:thiaminase